MAADEYSSESLLGYFDKTDLLLHFNCYFLTINY